MHEIYRFGDLPTQLLNQAGGKGASLCRMFQSGYPVPDGLVILPQALSGGRLSTEGEGRRILSEQLSLLGRTNPGGSYAVRSSALGEDSVQSSFAGTFETILNVQGEANIFAAVEKVCDSVTSERVQMYRQAQGLTGDLNMAVVIQCMIQPDFAGVLFTADPISGSHTFMAGNFTSGLGEQVVSGESNAQYFRISRPGGSYHGPDELKKAGAKLFILASRLEKDAGCPLDIEWAVSKGKVYLLQSRPVTTLQTIHYDTYEINESLDNNFLWTSNNIGEALPDVMTPFTWSIIRELDMETQKLDGYYLWSGNICGRGYSNVSIIVSLMVKFGFSQSFSKKMIGNAFGLFPNHLTIPIHPFSLWPLLKDLSRRSSQNIKRIQYAQKHKDEQLRITPPWCENTLREIEGVTETKDLLELWSGKIRPFVSKMWAIFLGGASDITLVTLLDRLTKMVGLEDANAILSNFRGEDGLESLGPLVGIARVIQGQLSQQEYMAKYGHRSPHEFEMSYPYPVEDPGYLEKQIREYRQSGVDIDAMLAKQFDQFNAARTNFIKRYPGKEKWLDKSLKKIRQAAQRRELLRSEFTRTFRVMRAFMLKAGELCGIGEDAFFLYSFEIPQLLSGQSEMLTHLQARKQTYTHYCNLPTLPLFIKGRFDPFEWAKNPDRQTRYFDPESQTDIPDEDSQMIRGVAGASGVVEGRVRILNDFSQRGDLKAGEILVTSTTNVGWTPLFPRAAAIVTDIGAPLSHAAIVARELGIPAVVGCGNATSRLKTGDRVRVDGGRGFVQII